MEGWVGKADVTLKPLEAVALVAFAGPPVSALPNAEIRRRRTVSHPAAANNTRATPTVG